MEPALRDGDWLIARRTRTVAAGQLVVVRDPADRGQLLVKRVQRVLPDAIEIASEAPHRDHLTTRPAVPAADIVGRPVFRYAPLGRIGPIR